MKRLTSLLCLCILPTFSVFADVTKTYSLTLTDPKKPIEIDVEVHRGSITIQGYKGNTVEISATFAELSSLELSEYKDEHDYRRYSKNKRNNRDEEIKQKRSIKGLKRVKNDNPTLEIEEDENAVDINSFSENKNVHLTVKVPQHAMLDLSLNRGGDITVNDVNGAMEIENHRGNVKAMKVTGPIVVETHQKDIEIQFSSLSQQDPSFLTSHAGDIDISVPNKMKSRIEVQTYKGEIFSGLTEEFKESTKVEKGKRGSKVQEITLGGLVAADVNGGGQRLTLNTYKGSIYIRKL